MSIEHAWLVKGWLLGTDAPNPILKAIDAVIARARDSAIEVVSDSHAIVDLSDDLRGSVESTEPEADCSVAALASPKKKRNWTPEARAAAAERMKNMRAAKIGNQRGNPPAPSMGGA